MLYTGIARAMLGASCALSFAAHATLGWTHGAGSGLAIAELIAGRKPAVDFAFCGR